MMPLTNIFVVSVVNNNTHSQSHTNLSLHQLNYLFILLTILCMTFNQPDQPTNQPTDQLSNQCLSFLLSVEKSPLLETGIQLAMVKARGGVYFLHAVDARESLESN